LQILRLFERDIFPESLKIIINIRYDSVLTNLYIVGSLSEG